MGRIGWSMTIMPPGGPEPYIVRLRMSGLARSAPGPVLWEDSLIEPLLLAVTRVTTVLDQKEKTNATGFFFERDGRVYLVTARHVLRDEASDHHPDSLLIELHVDPDNAVQVTRFMIPLFRNGRSVWREGIDSAGEVD